MQRFTGDGRRSLEVEDCVDDILDFADAPERVKGLQLRVGRRIVSGCLDDAERHGVRSDAL